MWSFPRTACHVLSSTLDLTIPTYLQSRHFLPGLYYICDVVTKRRTGHTVFDFMTSSIPIVFSFTFVCVSIRLHLNNLQKITHEVDVIDLVNGTHQSSSITAYVLRSACISQFSTTAKN